MRTPRRSSSVPLAPSRITGPPVSSRASMRWNDPIGKSSAWITRTHDHRRKVRCQPRRRDEVDRTAGVLRAGRTVDTPQPELCGSESRRFRSAWKYTPWMASRSPSSTRPRQYSIDFDSEKHAGFDVALEDLHSVTRPDKAKTGGDRSVRPRYAHPVGSKALSRSGGRRWRVKRGMLRRQVPVRARLQNVARESPSDFSARVDATCPGKASLPAT